MTQQSNLDARPVIALMTDFGIGDGDVGVMKGVIAGITPRERGYWLPVTATFPKTRCLSVLLTPALAVLVGP